MAAEVRQLDGRPLLVREIGDGPGDLVGHHQIPDLPLEVVTGIGRRPGFPLFPAGPGLPGADDVDRPAVRLGEQERPERSPGGIEPVWLVPEPEKHFLDDVFGLTDVAYDLLGQTEDDATVPAVDLGQRLLAEAPDRHHQLGVAELGHRLHSVGIRNGRRFGRDEIPAHPDRPSATEVG